MEKYVVYLNRFNEVKPYKIQIIFEVGDITDVRDLIENKNKTFKSPNILSTHNNFEDAKKEAIYVQKNYQIIPKLKTNRSNVDRKYEVCFTGFSKKDKDNLIKLAKENDLLVRTEITKKLSLLVCGDNSGPAKLKQASKMGISKVYGIEGFSAFIKTGTYIE